MTEQRAPTPSGHGWVHTGEEWIPTPSVDLTLPLAIAGMAYAARRVQGLDAGRHEKAIARVLAGMCPERLGELIESATLITALAQAEASKRPDAVQPWCCVPVGGCRTLWTEAAVADSRPLPNQAELLNGCPVEVWDGPYLHRCGLGIDRCAYHGPFERARRCGAQEGCRRPEGHGGRCG